MGEYVMYSRLEVAACAARIGKSVPTALGPMCAAISDDVLRRFQVLLDLEESRLEEEERRWSL